MKIVVSWDSSQVLNALGKLRKPDSATARALQAGALVVERHAKTNIEKHGLHKTGALVNSIIVKESTPTYALVGSVGIIYAAVHEFGATIYPKRAKMLSWIGEDGERIFAKRVRIPARPYLRPALDENIEEIKNVIAQVVIAELLK